MNIEHYRLGKLIKEEFKKHNGDTYEFRISHKKETLRVHYIYAFSKVEAINKFQIIEPGLYFTVKILKY